MSSTLQLQPTTGTANIIRFDSTFDPAAESGLTRRADVRRPVRKLSLALALAAGVVVGGLISLDAASGATPDLTGADVKTEAVAS